MEVAGQRVACQNVSVHKYRPRRQRCVSVSAQQATKSRDEVKTDKATDKAGNRHVLGLGDVLGPIGMSYGKDVKEDNDKRMSVTDVVDATGLTLGPIGLTIGESAPDTHNFPSYDEDDVAAPQSIHSMTTEEWRAKYEKDGEVDLWVEEEFNAGSRIVGGRAVYKGGMYGFRTGEGPSAGEVPSHKVTIYNHYADQVVEVEVPEDRYVLWEAEDSGLELPYACRMGCCTACAVRVKEGEMYQPEALGISSELRERGYALMCVGFPLTDVVLETVPEDEVYDLQFGRFFAEQALDPNGDTIERDDFAFEIAQMDE